jgi:RHS repeat-associated protein
VSRSVTRRGFTLGEQVAGVNRFYARDHLASIIDVTDAQSTVLATYSFDPWGRRTLVGGTDAASLGFTGHRLGSAGLTLTLYRAYDPDLGRWLSEDPMSLAGGLNLYGYVNNNPANLQDPLGLTSCQQKSCDQLLLEILNMAAEVSRRYQQYNNPRWSLPLDGPMSRQTHVKQINDVQRGLRRRIQEYNDRNCPKPIPVPALEIATRPSPVLTPSPDHLPEFPPPTPQQVRNMAGAMTSILMTAALLIVLLFG